MTKRVLNVCVIVFIVLFGLTACGGGGGAGGGASIPDSDYTTHNPGGWGGGGNSGGHNSGSANGGTNVTTQGGTPLVVNSFRYQGVTCSNPPDELVRMWHDDEKTGTFYAEFFCNNEPNPRQVRVVGEQRVNARGETNYVYTFNLQYKATCHVPGGTQDIYYFQDEGIDLNAYHDGAAFSHPGTNVWGWYDGANRYQLTNDGKIQIPAGDKGDREMYPVFQFDAPPSVEWIAETGAQEYTEKGADTYLYDYAQNTSGVKIQLSQLDFPGCEVTGNIDGGETFTLCPYGSPVSHSTHLTAGRHIITLNSSGGNDCAPQTFTKVIDVYVKPVLRIADVGTSSSSLRFRDTGESSATTDIYKSSYMTYGSNMPVAGLTALPECATVVNSSACLDGSAITPSSTAALGNHILIAEITGNYCVQPDPRNITIKIKPITAQITNVVFKMNVSVDGDFRLKGYLHLGVNGGNWQNIGDFGGNGIGMSGGDNNITGSCNAASVTLNALTDSISYEADTSDWDEYSGNDQLGYGSTGVALQTACDNRSDSNQYSIYLHTSHSDGSSDSTITVQLSE